MITGPKKNQSISISLPLTAGNMQSPHLNMMSIWLYHSFKPSRTSPPRKTMLRNLPVSGKYEGELKCLCLAVYPCKKL